MTVREAARRWMAGQHRDDSGSVMRSSKFYADRELWFFTLPSSFLAVAKSGHVNLLLQDQSLAESFRLLRVPYSFFFENQAKFDIRSDGEKFDIHISAKATSWLFDERSEGVDFAEFEH